MSYYILAKIRLYGNSVDSNYTGALPLTDRYYYGNIVSMYHVNKKMGFVQLSILTIGIIATALIAGGYFGYNKFQNYQTNKLAKEWQAQEQQKSLEETKQELTKLKEESKKIKSQLQLVSTQKPSQKLNNKEIIAKVKPGVVYIETLDGVGSGIIFTTDGYVLTNAHVVKEHTNLDVSIYTGATFPGIVVGRDEKIDLAVIKINSVQQFPKADLGDSSKTEQGDEVFALGFPFGIKGEVSFKEGTISRTIEEYFETSAEIHPGNSGGPLVDRYGQVIGINTAIVGKSIAGIQLGETIKLAIPISVAINLIPDLRAGRNIVLPKRTAERTITTVVDDYTAPKILSLTVAKPLPNQSLINITTTTDELSSISMLYNFQYPPGYNETQQISSTNFSKSTVISIPHPAWNTNTELIFSIKATDFNNNTSKEESYSVRVVIIPGMYTDYKNPLKIK